MNRAPHGWHIVGYRADGAPIVVPRLWNLWGWFWGRTRSLR